MRCFLDTVLILLIGICGAPRATDACQPACIATDSCILILQPSTAISLEEGQAFELEFVVGGLDLADVYFCCDDGSVCRSILHSALTVQGCTTRVSLTAPSTALFNEQPPESLLCAIRISPYGGAIEPSGHSEPIVTLTRRETAVTLGGAQVGCRPHTKVARSRTFDLRGRRLMRTDGHTGILLYRADAGLRPVARQTGH